MQLTARVPRIGYLARVGWPPARLQGFKQGLFDRGYVEGENITIEWRWAERTDLLPEVAAELVSLKVGPHRRHQHARDPGREASHEHHPDRDVREW
jgi:hypothetical protein